MHRIVSAAAIVAVALCAACGTSSSNTSSSGRAGSGDTSHTSMAGGIATTGDGTLINVCKVLPIAKASQIVGKKFTTAKASTLMNQITKCEYSGGNQLLQISISVAGGETLLGSDVDALKAVGHPAKHVSGVGDDAISEPAPKGNAGAVGAAASTSFAAVFGQTYIHIGGLTYVTAAQGKQIVELLYAAM